MYYFNLVSCTCFFNKYKEVNRLANKEYHKACVKIKFCKLTNYKKIDELPTVVP